MTLQKRCALMIAAMTAMATMTFSSAAMAETCKVTDPTGTPLNVRNAPAGQVIGKIANGKTVYISEYTVDDRGRAWAMVFDARTDAYIGWVYREFVSCY